MGNGENANISFSEFLRAVYVAIPLLHVFGDRKYSSLIEQTSRPKPRSGREDWREHLSFIPPGLLADAADRRIFLSAAFLVAFFPTTTSKYLKPQHPNGSHAMQHIPKTCGGDLKSGLQLSEGCDAWLHVQGATQHVILSQEETVGKPEAHVLGQQKGSPARGKKQRTKYRTGLHLNK